MNYGHPTAFLWTDQHIERLARLWAAGWSAGWIASEFGVTRNTIIGKAWRLKLPKRPTRLKMARGQAQAAPKWPRPRKPRPLPPEAAPLPVELMIPFERLQSHSCRYPHGNAPPFLFCGARRAEPSWYCAEHRDLCEGRPAGRVNTWPFRRAA
jgi:GcrA cell cycle regulator